MDSPRCSQQTPGAESAARVRTTDHRADLLDLGCDRFFPKLVEATGQPILYCDLDGTLLFVNKAGAATLAGAPADFVGRSVFELLPSIGGEAKRRAFAQAVATGEIVKVETHENMPVGERWFETQLAPVRGKDGTVTGIALLALDVTARKRVEEALRQSEAQWRTLTESSPDNVMLLDREGHILFLNHASVAPKRFVGTNHLDLITGDSRAAAQKCFAEVVATQRPGSYCIEYRDEAGVRQFEARIGPVLCDGQVTAFVMTATDITQRRRAEVERKQLEERIRNVQRLESLGMLAGGIAHDFNNLLTGILGHADIARLTVPESAPARKHIDTVIATTNRCAELTEQMLACCGRSHVEVRPVDCGELILDMRDILRTVVAERAVLDIDIPTGLPPVEADPSQLRQVVLNLVLNAAEATCDRALPIRIAVRPGWCPIDCHCRALIPGADQWLERSCVGIEVVDRGTGMTEETRAQVFDPFFTTKFSGRGLGMAVVYGILRSHCAGVVVESSPGRGTTIRIHFPTLTQKAASASQPANDLSVLSARLPAVMPGTDVGVAKRVRGTILVVDDEAAVREVSSEALRELGFAVVTAIDGDDALRVYQAHSAEIVCVLLDVTMPRKDGVQTLAELRQLRPELPVLLSSGFAEEETAARFAGMGFAGFLKKPYDIATLQAKLAVAMGA
jgi:PAS domain S-box-containing protein